MINKINLTHQNENDKTRFLLVGLERKMNRMYVLLLDKPFLPILCLLICVALYYAYRLQELCENAHSLITVNENDIADVRVAVTTRGKTPTTASAGSNRSRALIFMCRELFKAVNKTIYIFSSDYVFS